MRSKIFKTVPVCMIRVLHAYVHEGVLSNDFRDERPKFHCLNIVITGITCVISRVNWISGCGCEPETKHHFGKNKKKSQRDKSSEVLNSWFKTLWMSKKGSNMHLVALLTWCTAGSSTARTAVWSLGCWHNCRQGDDPRHEVWVIPVLLMEILVDSNTVLFLPAGQDFANVHVPVHETCVCVLI